ncbi:MAG: YicC/YloC family endoribonuclease, partial [Caulobacteraceae bacterium]
MLTLSSMTGFARVEGALGAWSWAVEARSVNGRNLEVRFRGPPGFDALERLAREAAQARFQRGQIGLAIQARRADDPGGARLNRAALERYLALSDELVASGRAGPPSLDGLLALRGVLESGDAEEEAGVRAAVEAAMGESLAKALDALKASRLAEGAALAPVLTGLADKIEALSSEAATEAEGQGGAVRDRFARRLSELLGEA